MVSVNIVMNVMENVRVSIHRISQLWSALNLNAIHFENEPG